MRRLLLLLPVLCVACWGPDHIEIDPVSPRLTHKGETVRLHGKVMDRNGKVYVRERAFFNSHDPKVASVDEHGNVTAVGSGHTIIEARSGGLRAEMPIDVDLVERLEVAVPLLTMTLADEPQRPPVQAVGRDGKPVKDREVSFASDDTRIVRIDPEGRAWAINPGETVIKARVEDKLAILPVKVMDVEPVKRVVVRGRTSVKFAEGQ
jgi:hypothetical protein